MQAHARPKNQDPTQTPELIALFASAAEIRFAPKTKTEFENAITMLEQAISLLNQNKALTTFTIDLSHLTHYEEMGSIRQKLADLLKTISFLKHLSFEERNKLIQVIEPHQGQEMLSLLSIDISQSMSSPPTVTQKNIIHKTENTFVAPKQPAIPQPASTKSKPSNVSAGNKVKHVISVAPHATQFTSVPKQPHPPTSPKPATTVIRRKIMRSK